MSKWPTVALRELLTPADETVPVQQGSEYPNFGMYSFGRGLFEKSPISGAKTSAPSLRRVRAGNFVFSRLFAFEGAYGLVDEVFDGYFVSNEYPSFQIDTRRLNARFLKLYFQLPRVWQEVAIGSKGVGSRRVRVQPAQMLTHAIPLPPISEQERIVSHFDGLAEKTRQLNEHLAAIEADSQKLLLSLHHRAASKQKTKVGDFLELREDQVPIRQEAEYIQVGVRSFGAGLFEKSALKGIDTSYRTFNRLYTDALVLSQVKGWEGALALCPESLEGKYVSPEYRTFQCIPGRAHPSYIGELVNTPWFWSLLQAATRGVGARRERTRPEQFLSIELPMPSFSAQVEISKILWRQKQMRAHFTELRAANDALIPATLERVFLR